MHALSALWLPILVAAIAVFVASMLIHMVFQWHRADYLPMPNEDAVRAAMGSGAPAPGHYVMPYCSNHKDMQNEDMQRKFRDGPVALVTVLPNGPPTMGGKMLAWFAMTVGVAAIAAGLAAQIYGHAGNAHAAAHLAAMLTLMTYAGGSVTNGIWMGRRPHKSSR
jgi:hypothetical protein